MNNSFVLAWSTRETFQLQVNQGGPIIFPVRLSQPASAGTDRKLALPYPFKGQAYGHTKPLGEVFYVNTW